MSQLHGFVNNLKTKYVLNKFFVSKILVVVILLVFAILKMPNFETTIWKSSDTNYQNLMNAMAMMDSEDRSAKILPIITFNNEDDFFLEYSSGAFDRWTGKNFFYVSFPSFPFQIVYILFRLTNLEINCYNLYFFTNILFAVSAWFIMSVFEEIFRKYNMKSNFVLLTGVCYISATEIIHSMGLTYWGQNWYMIFFPMSLLFFLRYIDKKKVCNLI